MHAASALHTPRLLPLRRAVELRKELRKAGGRLVLTNGVFDLIHPGHASYLEAARLLAGPRGLLFVALNSDKSVQALKGPLRPVMGEKARAFMLSQLRAVDGIVIFRGKRLAKEIAALRPDVYCKAGDYTLKTLDPTERSALLKAGSEVVFLPFIKGFSTTNLIARIHAAGTI